MDTSFIAHIRAHAHALVKLARLQPDPTLAAALETLAVKLLTALHDHEMKLRG
jgi:hypothetical protein